jgi:membrane protease YdiL (CAAX protease family)
MLDDQSGPNRITCSDEASSATLPLIVFPVLSVILHWGVLILSQVFPFSPLQVLMTWTPNISAMFVLIFVVKRPSDVRKLLQGWTIWRVSPIWYLVASSPMAIALMTVSAYLMLGGTSPGSEIPLSWILVIGTLILTFFTGATGEELGWRGFLLPRLQSRVSALTSSVVVGVCWGFWHLPLWLTGIWSVTYSTWAFFVRSIAMSVIITWAFNDAKQSVLIASLFHWFANISLLLASPGLGLIPTEVLSIVSTILYSVYAVIVVALYGPATLSNKSDASSDTA